MKIPGTTKDIIETFIYKHKFSIKQIAQKMGVSPRTIHTILKGKTVSSKTNMAALTLYVQLNSEFTTNRSSFRMKIYQTTREYVVSSYPSRSKKAAIVPAVEFDGCIAIGKKESA